MKKLRFAVVALFHLSLCLFLAGVFGTRLPAQTSYGTISGTVTDASGGAIADAQMTITNVASAEKRVQPTGADGFYNFVNLIPGTYRIEVEKPGFKHVTHPDVIVQVLACAGESSGHHTRGTVRPIQNRPQQSQEVVG